MRVIDVHRHLWAKEWLTESVRLQFATVGSRKKLPFVDPKTLMPAVENWLDRICDPDATKTIREMDELGTDVAIFHCTDWGFAFKEDAPTSIEEINKYLCSLSKKYPNRVYSLIGVDPRRPEGLRLFEKGIREWGAVGLNFFPPFGFYPNDPVCYPYYSKCVEFNVPVSVHIGYQHWSGLRNKFAMPICLDDVGVDFPDLVVIMGHSGMDTRASTFLWEQCVSIAEGKVNFYLEVADWARQAVRVFDDIAELVRKLRIMRDAVGAQRILFGTDQPAIARQDKELTRKMIEFLKNLPSEAAKYGANFSTEEVELILHGNAERIFKI